MLNKLIGQLLFSLLCDISCVFFLLFIGMFVLHATVLLPIGVIKDDDDDDDDIDVCPRLPL